jgi:phosphate transport system substrate-binding protein
MFRLDTPSRAVLLIFLMGLSSGCDDSDRKQIIQTKGSDSLLVVAQAWAEAYQERDSSVVVAVSGGGSGAGFSALINGSADLANASRAITTGESTQLEGQGRSPVQHVVGYDALAVYVHKDNPVSAMSLAQLAEIYGEKGSATKWSDLGITVPGCSDQEIILAGRQNNSGSFAYFKQAVLGVEQEFKLGTLDLHVSKDVIELVKNSPCSIGYSGMAYATEQVKMVCISLDNSATCELPSVSAAIDGSYPIARPLFMYSTSEAPAKVEDYLEWVLSESGQCILVDQGYAPVNAFSCS